MLRSRTLLRHGKFIILGFYVGIQENSENSRTTSERRLRSLNRSRSEQRHLSSKWQPRRVNTESFIWSLLKMANIIESVIISAQGSENKINQTTNQDGIVKKKLIVRFKSCIQSKGFFKGKSIWYMNNRHHHGNLRMLSTRSMCCV